MPKVSIIVPIYNVEQYLRECMDSVVNQTLKDIEIICVNDGSTDSSLSIIKEYAQKDNRIKIIDKPNSGYGDSMNKGLDMATGEYIGIVEPDDFVSKDMYEVLYNKAIEFDVDFVKADFYRFTGNIDTLCLSYNKLDRSEEYYNKVINPQEDLTPFNFVMNTWSGIYNRKFIEKYHIRHNTTPGASFQDNGFWFQTFTRATKIYFINKPLYMNRRDNMNSSVKNKEKVYCMKEEYDYILNYLNNNPELKEKFIKMYQYKKFHNYIFNYNRIDIKFKKEFLKVFSNEFKIAVKNGEIDWDLFQKHEAKKLKLIINKPAKFYRLSLSKMTILERIFHITKDGIYKKIYFCGIKIKFKDKHQDLINRINCLASMIDNNKLNNGKNARVTNLELKTINKRLEQLEILLQQSR